MSIMPSFFTKKIFLTLISFFIALIIVVWLVSSPIAKHYIKPALAQYELTLSDETSIRYNLLLSRVSVSDFALFKENNGKSETVFSLKELTLQVTLIDLLFDEITLSKAQFEQGFIKVVQGENNISIAGVTLPAKESNNEQAPSEQDKPETVLSYTVKMPLLSLSDFRVEVSKTGPEQNKQALHNLVLHRLNISDLSANLTEQHANLMIDADIDNTALNLTAQADFIQQQGEVVADLVIDNYPLAKLSPYVDNITDLQGSMSFSSQQKIAIGADKITVLVSAGKIENQAVSLTQNEQKISIADLNQQFSDMKLAISNSEITELEGHSQLAISDISVAQLSPNNENIGELLQVNSLAIDDMSFHFIDQPVIKLPSIVVNDIVGSQVASLGDLAGLPPIATMKQFSIVDTVITPNDIAIDTITFDTLQSDIILNKDKTLMNLVVAKNNSTEQPQIVETTDVEAQQTTPFFFSVNKVELLNGSETILTDKSVEPVVTRTLSVDIFTLGAISNKSAEAQETPFSIVGKTNKYANFKLDGTLDPFIKKPSYYITASLNEFSLPAISSYVKEAAKLEIKTGQLSTNLEVKLVGEQLDGNVALHLQGLETGIVDSHEAGDLIEQGALPLNMALGMLKDSDGAVELDVPISGSTSDPQFGIHSIFAIITEKAIMSATQEYLLTTFVPYANIVSVAISAGEYALKLRFDDLPYQVKQIEPNTEQKAYLDQFITLMKDKEDTKVTVCAVSVPEDINQEPAQEITDKKLIKQLKEVGEQREHAFKDYIMEHGDIESSRLLLCSPKIDTSVAAQPRISLSV